ncbi:hypothetical protein ANN_13257 [Periplaneta americana]|uniref:Uncharacterized protein n=1 Tax=Periplaneta americana TaxID=6978 RepID=A0ABQ8TJ14_PERAM|nr:hypothetical protein ANN_13257 [Periplaneta americana]
MIMSRDQNIVRNGNIKIGDFSFEEVEKFKYLGATVTNINDTREEIKRRINMGNAYYYSVQKLLSSSLLSKNVKVRIYKTVILPVVLYGCETWTLTLREKQRLRVFENKVLRKIFGAKRDEVTGDWRKLYNAELHALYSSPDIIRNIKSRRLRWADGIQKPTISYAMVKAQVQRYVKAAVENRILAYGMDVHCHVISLFGGPCRVVIMGVAALIAAIGYSRDVELAREGWKAWGKRWFPVHSPPALNDVSVACTQSHKTDTTNHLPYLVNDMGIEERVGDLQAVLYETDFIFTKSSRIAQEHHQLRR